MYVNIVKTTHSPQGRGFPRHSQQERVPHGVEVEAGPEEGALHLGAAVRQVLLSAGEVGHDGGHGVNVHHVAGQLVPLDACLD